MLSAKKFRILAVFIAALLLTASMTTAASAYAYTQEELDALRHIIAEKYVDPISADSLRGSTPKEIFSSLDEYSVYYTQEELQELFRQISGEYAGIGAYIKEEDGRIIIESPMPGSPAEKAGLKPGDEIYSVDGEVIRGLSAAEGAGRVRGPAGTRVTLGIIRGSSQMVVEFTVERAKITSSPVSLEVLDGIGYIKISEFNAQAYEAFAKAVGELMNKKVGSVILDLRDNPGGSLGEAVKIATLLVPQSPIVHIGYRTHKQTYTSFSSLRPFERLVVLVNENSASAAEILAAAVQDTASGTIVGKTTYGKGTVQRIYFLSNGEGFKLTEGRYLSPSKNVIEGRGVAPDIEVERLPDNIRTVEFLPVSFEREFAPGERSSEIEGLQQRLEALGYYVGDKAGVYGPSTRAAVSLFAKDMGLKPAASLTTELQAAIEHELLSRLHSREFDLQLKAALELLNEGQAKAGVQ